VPELFRGRTAGNIEAMRYFTLQPLAERRVGLDGQLARQGVAMRIGRRRAGGAAHTEVDQAAIQPGPVHPFRHRRIVLIGHQQRQAEAIQHARDPG
jgi:hypothetical protein